MDKVDFDLFF